ncbi:MAG: helix-turn-helix domain-containing protein [Oscillospiraceae bacterium]|nr:helix-turn-helix domain-containing protein [Oscillospiraceae bacterium]
MLPQRLKQLRADKAINQIQLAEKMGVTQGTVGKWETGKRTPDAEMLRKLSNYFTVPIDYLLSDGQSAELLLLTRISGLTDEDRGKLLNQFSDTIDVYLRNRQNAESNK